MDKLITEAVKSIGDPFLIVLLIIIYMLFKMLISRDKIIIEMTTEIHANGKSLQGLTKLMEVLVYGGGKHGINP